MENDDIDNAREDKIEDISNWRQLEYYNTKGTREKWVVENEWGFRHYFKKSKEGPAYLYEFWSEIIAYRLGHMLGMPVLRYRLAVLNDNIGCISQSMNGGAEEILLEGVQILQAYDPSFAIYNRSDQKAYTYQLIERAFKWLGWSMHMNEILQIIVFDAIIGNQDRHQENWGFIIKPKRNSATIKDFADIVLINQKGYFSNKEGFSEYAANQYITYTLTERFAPIYDNGSSLGRELTNNGIKNMLKNKQLIKNYVERGKSEIRWMERKVSHFEQLSLLNHESGYAWFDSIVSTVVKKFNETHLYAILEAVDQDVPDTFKQYRLSNERKEFILQLVTTRINYIKSLL